MVEVTARFEDNEVLREFYEKVYEIPHDELAEAAVDMYLRLSSIQSVIDLPEWSRSGDAESSPGDE